MDMGSENLEGSQSGDEYTFIYQNEYENLKISQNPQNRQENRIQDYDISQVLNKKLHYQMKILIRDQPHLLPAYYYSTSTKDLRKKLLCKSWESTK